MNHESIWETRNNQEHQSLSSPSWLETDGVTEQIKSWGWVRDKYTNKYTTLYTNSSTTLRIDRSLCDVNQSDTTQILEQYYQSNLPEVTIIAPCYFDAMLFSCVNDFVAFEVEFIGITLQTMGNNGFTT